MRVETGQTLWKAEGTRGVYVYIVTVNLHSVMFWGLYTLFYHKEARWTDICCKELLGFPGLSDSGDLVWCLCSFRRKIMTFTTSFPSTAPLTGFPPLDSALFAAMITQDFPELHPALYPH